MAWRRADVIDGSMFERLAAEQTALRRVATLVAEGAIADALFAAVVQQVAEVLCVPLVSLVRFEADDTVTELASHSPHRPVFRAGRRWPLEGTNVVREVHVTGGPARIDDYEGLPGEIAEIVRVLGVRSTVGVPIVVADRLWGAMIACGTDSQPLPDDTEARIAEFAELVGSAVANDEARREIQQLVEEQAALRRVATLVAGDGEPREVFAAVTREVGELLGADFAGMARFEVDCVESLAVWAAVGEHPPVPEFWPAEQEPTTIASPGDRVRWDDWSSIPGALASYVRDTLGVASTVACPITVGGRPWGALGVHSKRGPLPEDTESRLANFTELVATAIANADARAQLVASRARVLTAADDARRQVVRDLHDGAQQQLVQSVLAQKRALGAIRERQPDAEALVEDALRHTEQGNEALRELAHGILPSVLSHGGLVAGVRAITKRIELPVELHVPAVRFPAALEASAYFIVAEALTNVVKHARAERAAVTAVAADGVLRIEIRDDGVGGADAQGRGLVGIGDRVEALGGQLTIVSPAGAGTRVTAVLPLDPHVAAFTPPAA